jgi:hypothetical protein
VIFLLDLASHDHESTKEPWQPPFSFLCDEQPVMLPRLPQNRMMVVIHFLELRHAAFLSFHEPSEEYMMKDLDGLKERNQMSQDCAT